MTMTGSPDDGPTKYVSVSKHANNENAVARIIDLTGTEYTVSKKNSWGPWTQVATKSDLPKIIYVSQHETADRITINSGENISIDIPFTAQPGYKFVAIIDAWTDNDNVTTSNRYRKVENNNNFIHVNARNFSTQNNISVRIYTSILFIANI